MDVQELIQQIMFQDLAKFYILDICIYRRKNDKGKSYLSVKYCPNHSLYIIPFNPQSNHREQVVLLSSFIHWAEKQCNAQSYTDKWWQSWYMNPSGVALDFSFDSSTTSHALSLYGSQHRGSIQLLQPSALTLKVKKITSSLWLLGLQTSLQLKQTHACDSLQQISSSTVKWLYTGGRKTNIFGQGGLIINTLLFLHRQRHQ